MSRRMYLEGGNLAPALPHESVQHRHEPEAQLLAFAVRSQLSAVPRGLRRHVPGLVTDPGMGRRNALVVLPAAHGIDEYRLPRSLPLSRRRAGGGLEAVGAAPRAVLLALHLGRREAYREALPANL